MCFTINFQSHNPVRKHLLTGLSSMANKDLVAEVMFNSTYLILFFHCLLQHCVLLKWARNLVSTYLKEKRKYKSIFLRL